MRTVIKGITRLKFNIDEGTPSETIIDGYRFHVTRKDVDTVGEWCENVYVSAEQLEKFGIMIPDAKIPDAVGNVLEIDYGKKPNGKAALIGMLISEPAPAGK